MGLEGDPAGARVIERAVSFDRVATDYELGRPGYPAGVLDVLPLGREAEVLDLGAGTGKLTRVLTERYRRVVAVEPLDGMRRILEEVVPAAVGLPGRAEAIPLGDRSVDAVFVAQAFHWFATDQAVAEIARVLRPGGLFCLVWNDAAEPSPLPGPYQAYWRTLHQPAHVAGSQGPWWAGVVGRGPFRPLQEASVAHEQVQDRDGVLAFARSMSWIAHRNDDERRQILADLDGLLSPGPFRFLLRATVSWTTRT